jgi:hypothetical protein
MVEFAEFNDNKLPTLKRHCLIILNEETFQVGCNSDNIDYPAGIEFGVRQVQIDDTKMQKKTLQVL